MFLKRFAAKKAFFGVNLWRLRRAIVGIRRTKRGADVVCLGECQAEVGEKIVV